MKYRTFATMVMCATVLFGCGVTYPMKPTVEPTTFTPVEHKDMPILIFDDSVLDYSIVYSVLYDLSDIAILLSNKDGTYSVFGVTPEDCNDTESYTPGNIVNLSDEEATSFSYFAKAVGQENLSKTKFKCTLLHDSSNEVVGVKLDYYSVKGADVSG